MREFFGITSDKYLFEWGDILALLTLLNVTFIFLGFWWAPVLGLCGCGLSVWLNVRSKAHLNMYVMQGALIILNIYFLKG